MKPKNKQKQEVLMEFDVPISTITLLELYYYDKLWCDDMPDFDDLPEERIDYLVDSMCFQNFIGSERAKELQLEMLAILN